MFSPTSNARARALLLGVACALGWHGSARADARAGDPFAYNLRLAISPLAFQAGITQRAFGSAARIEYGPLRWLDIAIDGRLDWLNANRTIGDRGYAARAALYIHVARSIEDRALYGTVYPAETPALSPGGVGTAEDLIGTTPSEKVRGGSLMPLDRDVTLSAAMGSVQSLRLAVQYVQIAERARPNVAAVTRNRMPVLQLGYSFGTHWNLLTSVTGKREIGYRRFFFDAMLTLADLTKTSPKRIPGGVGIDFVPIGARVGMQGALQGVLDAAPELGLAYELELGMYPGRGGLEAYLLLALGLAYDVALR